MKLDLPQNCAGRGMILSLLEIELGPLFIQTSTLTDEPDRKHPRIHHTDKLAYLHVPCCVRSMEIEPLKLALWLRSDEYNFTIFF